MEQSQMLKVNAKILIQVPLAEVHMLQLVNLKNHNTHMVTTTIDG
jgi:hypothetical protein